MKVQPNNNDPSITPGLKQAPPGGKLVLPLAPPLAASNGKEKNMLPGPAAPPQKQMIQKDGLSLMTAALFIVGETAGTGVLAAPQAVAGCGWAGIAVIVICCFMAAFSGVYLGKCWLLVERLYPEYRVEAHGADSKHKIRNPYSIIGEKAAGSAGRIITSLTLILQLGGGAICMTLICSELIHGIVNDFHVPHLEGITFCQWILIIGVAMIPLSWFGSPADFWPVAVMAMGGTAVASVLVTYGIIASEHVPDPPRADPTPRSFFLALGTIIFGYGGASAMPTFQMDMKKKSDFVPAVSLAFLIMLAIFLPLSVSGYLYFGSDVQSSVLRNLSTGPILTAINVMMICHVFAANLILINPVNLLLEDTVGVVHSFNWKRCSLRVIVGLICIFIGLSVPRFGKILSFSGACAVSLQSFVLPPFFYIMLKRKANRMDADSVTIVTIHSNNIVDNNNFELILLDDEKEEERVKSRIHPLVKSILYSIMIVGSIVGVSSSIFSLIDLIDPNAFTPPCYIADCKIGD